MPIAGHLPITAAGELITGKLGDDLTTEEGYAAAQLVALALLATLKSMEFMVFERCTSETVTR